MKASSLSFFAAVISVLVGMAWGIVMAISQDHSAMPDTGYNVLFICSGNSAR